MSDKSLIFRAARRTDISSIVAMLADDVLGAQRETLSDPLPESYYQSFEAIDADANNELVVGEMSGRVVAVLQLTFIPSMTYRGRSRALIEGVRVHADLRGSGVGRQLFEWAIHRAREKGCRILQLTTDKARPEALRFYESLGFAATHEGMKLHLDEDE